ncbi:MAG: cell division protein ZapA [Enterovirga sp.]|nr:cell division protein ZapA [Enterovirga sp.]
MAHIQVTIAGKSYRMACGDGEEQHLQGLAASFDSRIQELRTSFGEIGDMRLHVMAALTMEDELLEAKRRSETLEAEIAALRAVAAAENARSEASERQVAEALNRTSDRIERLAGGLASGAGGGPRS